MPDLDWQARAACLGDLDFTEREHWETRPVCAGCPVRLECLELGIELAGMTTGTTLGGFGGASAEELVRLRRERGRRPREVRCEGCDTIFTAVTAHAKHCSARCMRAHWVRRQPSPVGVR